MGYSTKEIETSLFVKDTIQDEINKLGPQGINNSAKIRLLLSKGYSTKVIANEKNPLLRYEDGRPIRYQHVREVKNRPLKKI